MDTCGACYLLYALAIGFAICPFFTLAFRLWAYANRDPFLALQLGPLMPVKHFLHYSNNNTSVLAEANPQIDLAQCRILNLARLISVWDRSSPAGADQDHLGNRPGFLRAYQTVSILLGPTAHSIS
jgi:hypothetical protein